MKVNCVSVSHVQVPELRTRHTFVKASPGSNSVLSGTVTSATYFALRVQPLAAVTSGTGVSV